MSQTPHLDRLIDLVLQVWPEHDRYLAQRFAAAETREVDLAEHLATKIGRIIAADPVQAIGNYRWTCAMMLDEEYHFRRTGRYRHTSFDDVRQQVYDNTAFMTRYADGLLLSQLFWANHSKAIGVYRDIFLAQLPSRARLLEVGPGHGLLLALAAERGLSAITGWDISQASLAATSRALAAMDAGALELACHDLEQPPPGQQFDAVVASEILEHVQRPELALRQLHRLTKPGGWLFLNIPVNSPAPDHLTLWRTPEEVFSFVTSTGLVLTRSESFPMTGKTRQQATRSQLTMSCVAVCRRDQADNDL